MPKEPYELGGSEPDVGFDDQRSIKNGDPMTRAIVTSNPFPGDGVAIDKMSGYWLLARLGKRVLRPGGRALTDGILEHLAVGEADEVVELGPGVGATTELLLAHSPAKYTGIERDGAAVGLVQALLRGGQDRCLEVTAQASGMDDESADVVTGEAFLSMQSETNKQHIMKEAFRVLRPGGRFSLHELYLRPDTLSDDDKEKIWLDFLHSVRVGTRPLTADGWRNLVESSGFVIKHEERVEMLLLEPRRLVADEGLAGAIRIVINIIRDGDARRRVRAMRVTFRQYRNHLGAIGIVAVKPKPEAQPVI